jgi:hypothetical protein
MSVVISDLKDFAQAMTHLVQSMQNDLSSGKLGNWRDAALGLAVNPKDSKMDFGQTMDEFDQGGVLANDYLAAGSTQLFGTDLGKFTNALTVLGEAAGAIATAYTGASSVDAQNASSVDAALANAQPQVSTAQG